MTPHMQVTVCRLGGGSPAWNFCGSSVSIVRGVEFVKFLSRPLETSETWPIYYGASV